MQLTTSTHRDHIEVRRKSVLNESILKGAWIEKVQKEILLRSSGNSSLILQFRTTHKVNLSNTLYSF